MVSEEKNFLEKRLGAKEKLIKGNRQTSSLVITVPAGWSARSRPRKSRRRLRERLVSAVQSRHLHEGQKCDPEATRRLEKAGPPNPPEVKSDQTSLPNGTKVPICRPV